MQQRNPLANLSLSERFRGRLVLRVLTVLLPLAIVPMIVMGGAAYLRARTLLLSQITSQLSLFERRQINNLTDWVRTKHTRLGTLGSDPAFIADIVVVMDAPLGSELHETARAEALTALDALNPSITSAIFNQYLVVGPDGVIRSASLRQWEGLNLQGLPFFENHILGHPLHSFTVFSPAPLYSDTPSGEIEGVVVTDEMILLSRKLFVFTPLPIRVPQGETVGYVVGISETFAFQNILQRDLDLLPNASVFIFDLDEQQADLAAGVTRLRGLTSLEPGPDQLAQVAGGSYQSGQVAATFTSFDGLPVVGLYKTFPDLNVGLLFEVPQAQTFSEIDSLLPFTVALLAVASLLMAGVIIYGVRDILRPILAVVNASRLFADGDWQMRARVRRNDEIGLLAESFNQMADELANLYRSLEFEVAERTQQIVAAAEVAQTATSSGSLDELLNTTVNLIVDRFGYEHAAIFLVDESKEQLILREATGAAGENLKSQNFRIPINANSIVTWVARNNAPRLVDDISLDQFHLRHELLPNTLSELGVPISLGTEVLGVLDVQANHSDAFKTETLDVMGTLANQLATAIQNYRLLEGTEIDLLQISQLYRASRSIAQAASAEEIFVAASQAIQQSAFIGALYIPRGNQLALVELSENPTSYQQYLPPTLNISGGHALTYLAGSAPVIVRDVDQPAVSIHGELLVAPQRVNCTTAAYLPILQSGRLAALLIMASRDRAAISQTTLQPYASLAELITTALEKVVALSASRQRVNELQVLNDFSLAVADETRLERLYPLIHQQIRALLGEVNFFIALYDSQTDHISIPYLYEDADEANISIDPFPLGEGLTSIVIRTRQPLMLVEDTEQRARALGAKIVGKTAKSWLGVPLVASGEVIGVMTVQDTDLEGRFTEDDLRLMSTLASQIAGLINSVRLLELTRRRALQLRTAAEIARDTSGTLEVDELLAKAINLIRDRFEFYHASVFLLDETRENATVRESTGEAGRQMKERRHSLAVGSKSVVGYVTAIGEPLVVNDVTADPTHKFNPLLPDTRAELGIPLKVGDRVIGALDVQSVQPFAFHPEDIEILQVLADQLAVAVANAQLFSDTQESLAQHRLMHHVTTVAAASATLDEALTSAVQGLRVTLGDRVSILLLDNDKHTLRVEASAGYEEEVLGLQVPVGKGITGWVAESREPLLVADVTKDPRYVSGSANVRSEIAVPLIFRGEALGVLNVESDSVNAFDEHDLDILGTLAGSLAAIIVNARLAERQRQLFEVTNKIRRSVNMETILETTASELTRALGARTARIRVGGEPGGPGATLSEDNGHPNGGDPTSPAPTSPARMWTGSLPPLAELPPKEGGPSEDED